MSKQLLALLWLATAIVWIGWVFAYPVVKKLNHEPVFSSGVYALVLLLIAAMLQIIMMLIKR